MKYYGGKQYLSDSVASMKTEQEKIVGMIATYKEAVKCGLEISATGKIRVIGKTRSNASEEKQFSATVKNTMAVVSLEGLVMKKAMQGNPGVAEFTEADQEKLNELMLVAVNAMKGQ